MEGDMDMDVFNTAHDNEGFEGDEETSFINVDEDFYDNFSRAVASDTLENYDWGNEEQYEAARTKYMKEHGAANIPSWMELSDQVLSPLYYEDPLTTIEGAKERLTELEPNIDLEEIEFIKKDGKIYIRSIHKQKGKIGALKPLFTKDGEVKADLYRYNWFKEANRNRLQELEELNKRISSQRELEEVLKKLSEAEDKNKQLEKKMEKDTEEQRKQREISSSKILELEDTIFKNHKEIKTLEENLYNSEKQIENLKESKEVLSKEDEREIKRLKEEAAKLSQQIEDLNKESIKDKNLIKGLRQYNRDRRSGTYP